MPDLRSRLETTHKHRHFLAFYDAARRSCTEHPEDDKILASGIAKYDLRNRVSLHFEGLTLFPSPRRRCDWDTSTPHRPAECTRHQWRATAAHDGLETDTQTDMLLGEPKSAICVQRFDDSLNSAIHTTYRTWLRSSSMHEPRDPPLKVVSFFFPRGTFAKNAHFQSKNWTCSKNKTQTGPEREDCRQSHFHLKTQVYP